MSRKIVSFFAVVAMLALPAAVSAQCNNCGTSTSVYSTPIVGGAYYNQNVTYTSGMVYGSTQAGCCGTTSACCNSCAPTCCNQTRVVSVRRNNCCATPRRGLRGRFARQSYCNTGCAPVCTTTCAPVCNTACNTCCSSNCGRRVRMASCNNCCNTCCSSNCGGCNSCGTVVGCVGCAQGSSSGVVTGDSAAPVEPQAISSPSDVVTPPVPQEDK